ncbi:MAG: hypothetical protein ACYTFK_13785 [Planctomycetota bacterium]|jgi:hypothetical protein
MKTKTEALQALANNIGPLVEDAKKINDTGYVTPVSDLVNGAYTVLSVYLRWTDSEICSDPYWAVKEAQEIFNQ